MSPGAARAAPWTRLASWTIDGVVVFVAVASATAIHGLLGAAVLVVGAPGYYIASVSIHSGGTLGHRVTGIRVVDDRTGGRVGPGQAALRLGVVAVLLVPFAIPAAASAARLVRSHDRTTWHDLATQSIVIRGSGP